MQELPNDPLGLARLWVNPVTAARQKKRIAKRKNNRQNRKNGRKSYV